MAFANNSLSLGRQATSDDEIGFLTMLTSIVVGSTILQIYPEIDIIL